MAPYVPPTVQMPVPLPVRPVAHVPLPVPPMPVPLTPASTAVVPQPIPTPRTPVPVNRPIPVAAKPHDPTQSIKVDAPANEAPGEPALATGETWFRRNASGTVSLVVHLVLITVMALLVVVNREAEQIVLSVTPYDSTEDGLMNVEQSDIEQLTVEEMTLSTQDLSSTLIAEIPAVSIAEPVAFAMQSPVANGTEVATGGGGDVGELGDFAKRLGRAGAKTGDIQISLIWNNYNDLDLYVVTPQGEPLFFGHRLSRCHGELDVDMNAGRGTTREPVENIYWPKGQAPHGKFRVAVHHYRNHGDPDPTSYELRVIVDGVAKIIKGKQSAGGSREFVYEFDRSPTGFTGSQ
jgi:hypothetical protein